MQNLKFGKMGMFRIEFQHLIHNKTYINISRFNSKKNYRGRFYRKRKKIFFLLFSPKFLSPTKFTFPPFSKKTLKKGRKWEQRKTLNWKMRVFRIEFQYFIQSEGTSRCWDSTPKRIFEEDFKQGEKIIFELV